MFKYQGLLRAMGKNDEKEIETQLASINQYQANFFKRQKDIWDPDVAKMKTKYAGTNQVVNLLVEMYEYEDIGRRMWWGSVEDITPPVGGARRPRSKVALLQKRRPAKRAPAVKPKPKA